MKPEDLQPALQDAERSAKAMAICHSLGDYRTLLETGSDLQNRHGTIGVYLAARTWCAYLHAFTPDDRRMDHLPLLSPYLAEEAEALRRLTHHLTHRTYTAPTPQELATAAQHPFPALQAAQDFLDVCADEDGTGIEDRPITAFLQAGADPANLAAIMAQLCHATGRLLINHELDQELARLTGETP